MSEEPQPEVKNKKTSEYKYNRGFVVGAAFIIVIAVIFLSFGGISSGNIIDRETCANYSQDNYTQAQLDMFGGMITQQQSQGYARINTNINGTNYATYWILANVTMM